MFQLNPAPVASLTSASKLIFAGLPKYFAHKGRKYTHTSLACGSPYFLEPPSLSAMEIVSIWP